MLNAIGEAAESLLEDHQDRLIGTRIGHYRVVSILGHGGMSTVYRGERDDAQYQQTVAIKVLHHATLHPRLRSRLHSERHILATLDHPSIARLIDSGDLEDGTPYLVMEHVDGESIDAYCDSRTLFVRERLELFVQVCAAVQYAHRNLVVHRDIKAANIFVTGDGTPKLLDFGIAKLLAPESLLAYPAGDASAGAHPDSGECGAGTGAGPPDHDRDRYLCARRACCISC